MMNDTMKKIRSYEAPHRRTRAESLTLPRRQQNAVAYAAALEVLG